MIYVPKYLTKPLPIMFFEMDEVAVLMTVIYLSMTTGGMLMVLVAVPLTYIFYKKQKKENGRGFIRHVPHILGFKAFKGFPHSHVKEFME